MAREEMVMPKMGESIMEGTVIEWKKKVGETVEQDETVLEIATDKVDSEVPAPISGTIVEILADEGDTVEVGKPIAIIETDAEAAASAGEGQAETKEAAEEKQTAGEPTAEAKKEPGAIEEKAEPEVTKANGQATPAPAPVEGTTPPQRRGSDGRFYSPLVRSIAKEEGISQEELETIEGSGNQGRVSKDDILNYVDQRKSGKVSQPSGLSKPVSKEAPKPQQPSYSPTSEEQIRAGEIKVDWPKENVEIIKMDRMRKVIADHMIRSKQTSAHVTTFAEADVTKLVNYRNNNKEQFYRENGFKLTFTPFFIEATIKAIREFPLINSSVDGDQIILKRDINYGLAVALGESGTGGLIVPVIKNAGQLNIHGLAQKVHELANKARSKNLSPDDLVGGTFTLTNYGSVGNLMGTPIINQPQVAIFGTGAIEKKPVVMETENGDVIAIRYMMYLSMSYDHRIIDGAHGGAFMQRVKELLENFDVNRSI
jgi:2-oxoglutarate dehydrogenase dihydrolipoamide succinyltransferase (E2 component)